MLERLMNIYDSYLFSGASLDVSLIISTANKHDWLNEQKDAYDNFAETFFAQFKNELNSI